MRKDFRVHIPRHILVLRCARCRTGVRLRQTRCFRDGLGGPSYKNDRQTRLFLQQLAWPRNSPVHPICRRPRRPLHAAGGVVAGLRAALGGLWADPFRLLLVVAVNVALVVGIVSTAVILRNRKPPPKPITLAMALGALDCGNVAEARRMAERLAASKNVANEEWGGSDFILGTLAARAAEEAGGKQRTESFRLASLYLARSRERGFPEHRESAGLYLLGKSLYLCGRLEDALPVLEQALLHNADRAAEIGSMLIEARAGVQPPEFDKALAESRKLLSDPHLDDAGAPGTPGRWQVLIQQAQILIRMNRGQECAAVLDKIPDNPLLRGEIRLLRGRLALREGQALKKAGTRTQGTGYPTGFPGANEVPKDAKDKFRWAIESFRKALGPDQCDSRVARQANYLIGLCLMEQGDLPAALNQLERTSRLFPETPEDLAALYQQGEIARRMGRHAEAVSAYRRLLALYARQNEFHNPWVNLAQLKATLVGVCLDYLNAEKYETALLLSKALLQLLSKDEALQLTARIYRTWGDNLLRQAEHLPPERAEELRRQARTQFAGPATVTRQSPASSMRPASIRTSFGTPPALLCRPRLPPCGGNTAAVHAQRGPPAARPGPGRSGRGRTLAGRDRAGVAVVPRVHPAAPARRGHLPGSAAGQPGRREHGRSEAGRSLLAKQPRWRATDPGRQGMARFTLRPGRVAPQFRTRSRGDPAFARSVAALPRRPPSDRRPLPAGRQLAAAGDGLAPGWGRRFLPQSAGSA